MKRLFVFLLCITLIFPAAYSEALLFKQCPDCGWTIRNDDKSINFSRLKFCKDCGVELVDAPQETQTPAPTASPTPIPTATPAPAVELPAAETKIGDIITFGHYEQDGNLSNGKEEIEWIVLDKKDDQILVISQYILDCQPFHTSMIYVSWKNSFLRQWLNDDFFNTAFSEEEQSRIPTVTLSSESNGAWTLSGYETNDKIFLLNETEANDYFPSNHARKGEFTAYAAQLKNAAWGNTSTWWLRTPGAYEGSDVAHFIDDDGIAIYSNGAVSGTDVIALLGVRPAMWISLAESAEEKETVPSATAATPASTAAATLSETLPFIQGKIGETFTFGHYEQDGDLSNGSEPIEWMVLDQKDDQILVISQYGLEPYDINDPNTPISWKDFPIRSWLNEEFLHSAFSVTEQELISLANVSTNEAKTAFTQDMLFLLSYAEADEYFPEDADRIARGTPYYAQTSWVSDEQACFWWLRPLDGDDAFHSINMFGSHAGVFPKYLSNTGDNAVRPALWLSLSKIFTINSPVKTGDIITMGQYEQDNDRNNGKENIEWLVLAVEDTKALVISRYGLACKPYHTDKKNITWEKSSLRAWLNNDFYSFIFSKEEQARVLQTTVPAEKNPDFNTDPGKETTDKIFLLSIGEVKTYFPVVVRRQCQPTAYAKHHGAFSYDNYSDWWLRSPGDKQNCAADVDYNGFIYEAGTEVNIKYKTVRPAMWIRLIP